MRGRPTFPTGQEKYSVGATAGSPLFLFLQGKVGYWIAPSSAPVCALGHLPPEGKALGGNAPSRLRNHPSQPAQLGGGPLRASVHGPQARQKKKEDPLRVPPTRKGGSRAERTSLRPGVLSSGFLPKKAGLPRRSRRGKPTSQVWTCTGSGHPHRRPPLTPPAAGRRPGHAPPVGSPAPPGRAPRPQWCWGARPG